MARILQGLNEEVSSMDATQSARLLLPLLVVLFLLVLLVWPVLRLRRVAVQAVTLHRRATPGQRIGALAFLVLQLGVLLLAVVYAAWGPVAVGAWPPSPAFLWLGIGLLAAGLVLAATAQRQMGISFRIGIDEARTPLVDSGLFRVVRNPIYSALLLMLAGVVLIVPCVWSALLWLAALCTIAYQTRLEERHLLALHGDAYRRYASRTGRFVPGLGRLRSAS
jgi:protein-S-isoprenylcysteine O-methyltransferase Ste14